MACSVRAAPRNKESTFQGRFFSGSICTFCPRVVWRGSYLCPEVVDPTFQFWLQRICKQLGQSQSEKYAARAKGRTCNDDSFLQISSFPWLLFGYLQPIWHQLATICNVDSWPREQLHLSKPCSIEQNWTTTNSLFTCQWKWPRSCASGYSYSYSRDAFNNPANFVYVDVDGSFDPFVCYRCRCNPELL